MAPMSDALYERYKDALQRGHVAAARGRDAAALEAYSEAAKLAPDRALPLVGLAGVLRRLGKATEAITTIPENNEHPQGDKLFDGKKHQVFGHQNISLVEKGKLKVVHRTSIQDGLYENNTDYTKQAL